LRGTLSVRKYVNKPMSELATELAAGLVRLRKGYVDAAESLIRIIEPERQYPLEFALYRITGFRGQRSRPAGDPINGEDLTRDLQSLMLDVCDSFMLRADEYDETVFDNSSLARRFNVSTKTVQRWRHRGLPARRLVFPDGKRRIGFLASSVDWFVSQRPMVISRSVSFSQLSRAERDDIISRARKLAHPARSASEIILQISNDTSRAVETIRYTIRRHDKEEPESPVFPRHSMRLDDQEKVDIYRSFLHGLGASALATRFGRTRGSIYRIVNEVRAKQLMKRSISYIHSPEFEAVDAEEAILVHESRAAANSKSALHGEIVADIPPYLKALYEVPLLTPTGERDMFRRYNYLKYKADKLRQTIDISQIRTSKLKEIEKLLLQANVVKNRLVRANLRLVVSIAKKHLSGPQTLLELVSDGNLSLIRAVEKFDYTRGFRFSTYASWAIMRNFARSVPKERYQLDRFTTGYDEVLGIAASLRTYDPNEANIGELRESIDSLLAQLLPRERAILIDHYGLDEDGKTKTLSQLGQQLGLSKERVRQIELQALDKLRRIAHPEEEDFLG